MTSSFRFFVKRKTIPGSDASPSTRGSGGGHAWPRYLYQSRNQPTTSDIYRAGGNDDASSEHFDHGLHWSVDRYRICRVSIHPSGLVELEERAQARAISLFAAKLGTVMPFWYALSLVLLLVETVVHGMDPANHSWSLPA